MKTQAETFQVVPFNFLCDRLNRELQARQIPCLASWEGKAIQILDSSRIPNELITNIFMQAWTESECARSSYKFTIQKDGTDNWKISFQLSGKSLRKEQPPVQLKHYSPHQIFNGIEDVQSNWEISFQNSPHQIFSGIDVQSKPTLKQEIVQAVLKAVHEYLNEHEGTEGIWYPDEYRKCLLEGYDMEMPDSMNTGYANDRYFNKISPFVFVLKEGARASEALLAFLKGPTVADCGNATTACHYKAVLDILGEACFDRLFGVGPFALRIDQLGISNSSNPISFISDFTPAAKRDEKGSVGRRPLSIGDECHFQGVIFYGNKHPRGCGGGFNVIYKGDNEKGKQLFIGRGLSKPSTEMEIIHHLINLYNEERTDQDIQYIKESHQPAFYDRNLNLYLQHFYEVPFEMAMMRPDLFFKGYWSQSPRCLDPEALALIKGAEDPLQMMNVLKAAKLKR